MRWRYAGADPVAEAHNVCPAPQLSAIDPHEVTSEAIKDWQYWVAQGHCF